MMLVRVSVEKALPFEVKVPNAVTVRAMRASGKRKRSKTLESLYKDLGI